MNKYIMLFNTIKFLKPIQINYRVYYLIRNRYRNFINKKLLLLKSSNSNSLEFIESINIIDCYLGNREFKFLNLSKEFKKNIDWNYIEYGKLWTYNLTYFDFLSQNHKDSLCLIDDFIDNIDNIKDGLEPFPISLRGINWIKYISYNNIINQKINDSLYAQYYILLDNLEYHLFGNHLLENVFSLLFGAYYFKDDVLYEKSKEMLTQQLEEQILEDGGHFELSPMYHQIMLFRLLDCINLLQNNSWKKKSNLLDFLVDKAELMLGWLENISYKDGTIPLVNDSTNNIAPTSLQLLDYANRLNIQINNLPLSKSGYRKISKNKYECIVDIGHIGAEYIPGHAHADTFNFELQIDGKYFIVDTGLSTYETNDRRILERTTSSHNTVEVNGKSQSEVWGGFRVANRANIIALNEGNNTIEATHDGYKKDNIYHTRKWSFEENKIIIEDSLSQSANGIARFHFSPNIHQDEILNRFNMGESDFEFKNYEYSPQFNMKINALVLQIKFQDFVKIEIKL